MLKVATFSRTSTDNISQSKSIGNQEDVYKSWIEKNNCVLYKNYIDEGISGTKGRYRVEWKELIQDGKEKKYDILLSKSYSRFGRNMVETLSAIKELREAGIRIIFIEDNLDSTKDTTNFGLFSWLAEMESKKTSERIKTVFDNFKEKGKIYNCIAPWGYDYDIEKKNFVINEVEASIIRRIFKLYVQGNGTTRIANILTSEGIKGKNGGVIRGNTIKNTILNEVYVGTLVQGKSEGIDVTISKRNKIEQEKWIKHLNNHEAIITYETFIEANKIFKVNSEKAKKHRYSIKGIERSSNASLFSNLLICSNCGASITIRRKKGKKIHYNCSEYEKVGVSVGHTSNRIDEDFLVEYILFRLNELIERDFDIININANVDIKKELENQLQAVEKSINEQMKKTRNLINLYDEKVISMNQFKLENETISNTLDSLMKNKEILEDKIKNIPQETGSFKKDVESVLKIPVEQWNNSMLKTIIKKIYVNNDGTINVQWIIEG
ncbi:MULTISPECIES: recombinase family protein [Clostridium]|uniref:recombinase family protein n=1 Tax=Clostridium TaxID=1485 RepID=UPI0018AC3FB2|nr:MULTISPECIES: recombinase family protein [Clostridium]MBI6078356.1 recombinase family protein [Clostridium perfringens]MBI6083993.1 recombinase family protein [Clostridium perfringens]MBI6098995.1 recombinase family protein [Clostridium perfringens]